MGLIEANGLVELLTAAERNHMVIANNLANVDTPGYRTFRIRFVQELDRLLDERTNLLPGTRIQTELYQPMFADVSADGNDVTLEREIVELNKNVLKMRVYLAVLGARIAKLRTAIESR